MVWMARRQQLVPRKGNEEKAQPDIPPGSPTPYQQAAETIRSTAKWLVTAFAGVGGVLIAGIPLTGLGKLQAGRLTVAIIAIAAALAAIAFIIPRVSQVFTAKYITLADLTFQSFPKGTGKVGQWLVTRRLEPIMSAVDKSRDELYGAEASDLADLNEKITQVNEVLRAGPRGRQPASLLDRSSLAAAAERVVAFANYEDVRRTFRSVYRPMAIAAAIVAAGVVVFAYVVGSTSMTIEVTTPSPVLLSLNPSLSYWPRILGPNCDISRVDAVAISGDFFEPEVITSGTRGCKVARFKMTPTTGLAVPVVAIPTPSPGKGTPTSGGS
jgi:hypothetical protein